MPVTIVSTGASSLMVTGLGAPNDAWGGVWEDGTLTIVRSRPDGGGTTASTYRMTREGDRLVGEEEWVWTDPSGGSCPDGRARVEAVLR